MRSYLFLPSLILCTVLCYLPTYGTSQAEQPEIGRVPDSQSQVIRLSDAGVAPLTLKMKRDDKVAFFLNDSSDSLVTLELSFGKHATHCASSNLQINDDGSITSVKPIAPKDFASSCFHEPGTYTFTVYGLKGSAEGIKGSIIIE